MKSVFFAIVCLVAATAVTSAADCEVQCTGEWSGNSSVVIEVGSSVDIIFDVTYKIFAVVNTDLDLSISVKGNFLLILNIKTGAYLIIDLKTQYAVIGKIEIDFVSSGGSIDYDKLVIQLNAIFVKYVSITSSTSGSFNFSLLIVAYFSGKFDLTVIYSAQIAAQLRASFGAFLVLVQNAVVQGSITAATGIWGFIVVAIGIDVQIGLYIVETVKICIQTYGEIQIQLIVELVKRIRIGVSAIKELYLQIFAYITVQGSVSISQLIQWVNNASNKPVELHVTLAGSTYVLVVVKIDQQYIINFTVSSSSGRSVDIRLVLVGGVLFIYNLKTNIAIALYQRYLLILNVNSNVGLLLTWQLIGGLKVAVVSVADLSVHIRAAAYDKFSADIKAIISSAKSITISWSALVRAVASGSVSAVSQLIGSVNASIVIQYYGSFCVEANGSNSVGGIVVTVFGSNSGGISVVLKSAIDIIASAGQNWGLVVKYLTAGKFSVSA